MSQHQPNPSPPPVQKLRVRYAKRGRLRFTSHRDLARAFERALRRAGVPMAYSQGFNPRPKLSWSGAVPTGAASEAEYMEMQLAEQVEPATLVTELNVALPEGMCLLEAVPAAAGALADRLEASRWVIEVPEVDISGLQRAVAKVMEAESVEVERMTKDGRRTFDARAALVSAQVRESVDDLHATSIEHDRHTEWPGGTDDGPKQWRPYGILEAVVRQTTPVVRPDDVLSALRVVADLAPGVARATRLEQGRLDDGGGLVDPLAPDRG